MKIVILKGFSGTTTDATSKLFKRALGKDCLVFAPTWERRTLTDYLQEWELFLKKHNLKDGEYIACGFSMGAYILMCSESLPYLSVYCSLSPLFPKFMKWWPKKWLHNLGKKRTSDLGNFKYKPRSLFIVGEKEPLWFRKASIVINRVCGSLPVAVLENVGHDISHPNYFTQVVSVIRLAYHGHFKNIK